MKREYWKYLPIIFPYVRRFKGLAMLSILLAVLGAGGAIIEPWPLAFLVDSVLGERKPPGIITALVGDNVSSLIIVAVLAGIAVALLVNGFGVVESYVNTKLEQRIALDFRSDLFEHCQGLSQAYHDARRSGDFMYRINFEAQAAGAITVAIPPLLQSLVTLVGIFLVTYRLAPALALLSLAVVPFIYYSTGFYGKKIEPKLLHVRNMEGLSLSIVNDAFSMLRVIVAFNRQDYEWRRFRSQGEEAVGARVKVTVGQTLFNLAVMLITAAGTGLVIGVGAHRVLNDQLTVGELLVILSYIAAIYNPLQTISSTLATFQEQLIAMRMARQLLDTEPEVKDAPDARDLGEARGEIAFDHVDFSYGGRTDTLKRISFTAEAGSVVAVVGPTGAGKTTLVNLIPRFYDVASGAVLLDGHDVRSVTQRSLRQHISIVHQEPMLFSDTILDNIRYGRLEATEDEVVEAAKAANAHDFIMRLPEGYQTRLGERGAKLSGGERQRVSVARAFLKNAPVLILDEPTSAVDSRTEHVILEALQRLMKGRTTIMIAHRLSTIRNADLILVMNEGELVEEGTHHELLERGELYRSLWDMQTGQGAAVPPAAALAPAPQGKVGPAEAGGGEEPAETGDDGPAEIRGDEGARVIPLEVREVPEARETPVPTDGPGPEAPSRRPAPAPSPSPVVGRPKVVVLGMMTKMPVAGVVWQTVHYLLGFERLGYEAYYVEAHARTPSMLMARAEDDGAELAARFIDGVMRRFGLEGRWAYHALHDDGQVHGMSRQQLDRLYRSAALIVNLHGGTEPLPEHSRTGRLVYLETDPVQLQVELHDKLQATVDFLEPHVAFFTFGENLGTDRCPLPTDARFPFVPTRQPVLVDLWQSFANGGSRHFTTVGNWQQSWRTVAFGGRAYHWSKHLEFAKILDLPARTDQTFELVLASCPDEARRMLEEKGWRVRPPMASPDQIDTYARYIGSSRGELTVAKGQNVELRTGWFSDRSATYLAAGRPVVTQETGFSDVLPTGEGLLGFSDLDGAVSAVEALNANYARHRRAAERIARQHFAHDVVLGDLLEQVGLRRSVGAAQAGSPRGRGTLDLEPARRRPLVLEQGTVDAVLGVPVPEPERRAAAFALGEQRPVSVVGVTYDNLVLTRLCLESVLTESGCAALELVVVDNASTDGTRPYLQELAARHPEVRLVLNDSNMGFAPACNQGLAAATGEVLVILNNDTIVPPGAVARLTWHLRDPGVGLVGPVTNRAANEAQIDSPYRTYDEMVAWAQRCAEERPLDPVDIPVLTMFCVAMRRDTYARVGPLDERFSVGMFEDDDYAVRVRGAGLRVVLAENVFVHHFGEASFGKLVATGEYAEIFKRNREAFERKWGVSWENHGGRLEPEYLRMRDEVRQRIGASVPEGSTVVVVSRGDDELLDVGGRQAWHFPRAPDGSYAGHYPGDSEEAIAALEALVSQGARYLVLPSASAWWLEHYRGLAEHLADRYRAVCDSDHCVIFERAESRAPAGDLAGPVGERGSRAEVRSGGPHR